MKKCFAKLVSLLFIVTTVISPAYGVRRCNEQRLPFRHALQMPASYICEINECAKSVNSLPDELLDIRLNGEKVGKETPRERTTVYAFKNVNRLNEDVSGLVAEIQHRIDTEDKEFVFTGYGKGANLAAKVVSRLRDHDVNQMKLVVFCADSKIRDNLRHMYLSCKLHFCKRDEEPCYDSSVIECNMSPTVTERFSAPKCAVGAGGLLGANLLLKKLDKCEKISAKTKKRVKQVVNVVGGVASAVLSFSKQQDEYLSNDEIGPRFKRMQSRAWGADFVEEWYHLGDWFGCISPQ